MTEDMEKTGRLVPTGIFDEKKLTYEYLEPHLGALLKECGFSGNPDQGEAIKKNWFNYIAGTAKLATKKDS